MAEIAFAKAFLATLDARPVKLPADYVEDAKAYPARPPFILPRMAKPMRKPVSKDTSATASASTAEKAPGSEPALTVSVRSVHRAAPLLDVRVLPVTGQPPFSLDNTTIQDVRTALSTQTGVPVAKLRLLYHKKPAGDGKTLRDVVGDDVDGDVRDLELGVMVVGGAATVAAAEKEKAEKEAKEAKEQKGTSETEETKETKETKQTDDGPSSEAFWNDLRTFLVGRLADAKQADEVFSLFVRAWDERMI